MKQITEDDQPRSRTRRADHRLEALSRILAVEAARWPDVIRFRERHFGDKPLLLEEIQPWVEALVQSEGASRYLTVALPLEDCPEPGSVTDDRVMEALRSNFDAATPQELDVRIVQFPAAGAKTATRSASVRARGVLDEIRKLADRLKDAFGWSQPEAVAFVLAGNTPAVRPGTATVGFSPWLDRPKRITIELSGWATVDDLLELFRWARHQTFLGHRVRYRRYKPVSRVHAELAEFLAATPELSWRARQERWNAERPADAYASPPNFRRDAVSAYRRITGRPWRRPRKEEIDPQDQSVKGR